MPQVPGPESLSDPRIDGSIQPAQISENAAREIGFAARHAEEGWNKVSKMFETVGERMQKTEDDGWLANAKIQALQGSEGLKNKVQMDAGPDGAGLESYVPKYRAITDGISTGAPNAKAKAQFDLWSTEHAMSTGQTLANEKQRRFKQFTLGNVDQDLDALTNNVKSDPENAEKYFDAFSQKIDAGTGSAWNQTDALQMKQKARQLFLKEKVTALAERNPDDYFKAQQAYEEGLKAQQSQAAQPGQTIQPGQVAQPDQQGQTTAAVTRFKPQVNDAINKAAQAHGLDPQLLGAFAMIESSGNPGASTGKYRGLFQMGPDEWARYGQGKNIYDVEANADAGAQKLADQSVAFQAKYGRSPTALDLYMIHQQGEGGYANHVANPDAPAWQNMYQTGEGQRRGQFWAKQAIWGNVPSDVKSQFPGGVNTVTSADFFNIWQKKLERFGAPSAATGSSPLTSVDKSLVTDDYQKALDASQPSPIETLQNATAPKGGDPSTLSPDFQVRMAKMLQDAPQAVRDGILLNVGDPSSNPGADVYAKGQAVDLEFGNPDAKKWVQDNAGKYGVYFPNQDSRAESNPAFSQNLAPSTSLVKNLNVSSLPTVDGKIQPGELASMNPRDYDSVQRSMKSYAQVSYQERVQNAVAQILSTGDQNIITSDELRRAAPVLGPKVAEKWQQALDDARDTHNIVDTISKMTPGQQSEWLRQLAPNGYEAAPAEAKKIYDKAAKAIQSWQTNLKKDPYQFLSINTPDGKTANSLIANASPGPEGLSDRERGFGMLVNVQRQNGIRDEDIQLMSKGTAKDVVEKITNAKSGPDLQNTMDTLRGTYGKYFGQVWSDLVKAGAPNGFLQATKATTEGQNAIAQSYAMDREMRAVDKGDSKSSILKRAGIPDTKTLTTATSQYVAQAVAAMPKGEITDPEALRQSIEKVVPYYMISKNLDVGSAAQKAYEELFSKNYTIYGNTIVPKTAYEQHGSDLRRGIDNFDSWIRQNQSNIRVPFAGRTYSQSAGDAKYFAQLQRDYRVVDSGDGRGAYVQDQFNKRIQDKSGNPILIPWSDIAQHGAATPRTFLGFRAPDLSNLSLPDTVQSKP